MPIYHTHTHTVDDCHAGAGGAESKGGPGGRDYKSQGPVTNGGVGREEGTR